MGINKLRSHGWGSEQLLGLTQQEDMLLLAASLETRACKVTLSAPRQDSVTTALF